MGFVKTGPTLHFLPGLPHFYMSYVYDCVQSEYYRYISRNVNSAPSAKLCFTGHSLCIPEFTESFDEI